MAAQDYYGSFSGHPQPRQQQQQQQQQYQQQRPNFPYQEAPPQSNGHFNPHNGPPPAYSVTPSQQQLQHFPPPPQQHPPYPQQYAPPQQSQQYLQPPLKPQRSHSEPPEDQRNGYVPHQHHHHHHQHSSPSRSRSRSHSRSRRRRSSENHKNRDTFLGAGGGAIIGDAIFPGLGTLGGLVLGGYGGRKHAEHKDQRRSRSTMDGERHHHHQKDGFDPETGKYKSGWVVR